MTMRHHQVRQAPRTSFSGLCFIFTCPRHLAHPAATWWLDRSRLSSKLSTWTWTRASPETPGLYVDLSRSPGKWARRPAAFITATPTHTTTNRDQGSSLVPQPQPRDQPTRPTQSLPFPSLPFSSASFENVTNHITKSAESRHSLPPDCPTGTKGPRGVARVSRVGDLTLLASFPSPSTARSELQRPAHISRAVRSAPHTHLDGEVWR